MHVNTRYINSTRSTSSKICETCIYAHARWFTVGNLDLCCCPGGMYFKSWLTPLCVDNKGVKDWMILNKSFKKGMAPDHEQCRLQSNEANECWGHTAIRAHPTSQHGINHMMVRLKACVERGCAWTSVQYPVRADHQAYWGIEGS